jgi:hypothetical protein
MAAGNTNRRAGDVAARQALDSGRNPPAANSRIAFPSQATRCDTPVNCPACGRAVPRKARQQTYCSRRCRQRAYWDRKATARIAASVTRDTGRSTKPSKSANSIKGLPGQKSGSSDFGDAPLDLVGGGSWRWPGTRWLDPTKRRSILEREIPAMQLVWAGEHAP